MQPLKGASLEKARAQFIRDYVEHDGAARMIEEEVCHNPEAMRVLDQMTQSQHYFRATLPALERSVATTRATTEQRREAQPRQAATSSVQGMSESDYDAEYGRVFTLFKEAEAVNDGNAKARWSRELMQMAEARFKR